MECREAVVATNTPVNDRVAIHTKQAPYLTYAIGGRCRAGSVTRALYWDTPTPTTTSGSSPFDDARRQC